MNLTKLKKMKITSIFILVFGLILVGCNSKPSETKTKNEAGELESVAYTIYSEKTELFVEFKPLVVGKKSNFAAHFTVLGERFLPLTEGKVTVSLLLDDHGIRHHADSASSPGIYRLALIPKKAGKGKLVFDIFAEGLKDQVVIENVVVFSDEASALKSQAETVIADEIVYLKEQAWKVEFANAPVEKLSFSDIIKTSGQLLSAPGDETVITASARGIINFSGNQTVLGASVTPNTRLFTISGGNLAENNLDVSYKEAKANYEKANLDYERSKDLVADKIISNAVFLQVKNNFENSKIVYDALRKNYSTAGQSVRSPMNGFVKNILVKDGQFVEAGASIAVVSKNKKLILQASVSQKYFSKLNSITSANFQPIGTKQVFNTKMLNGKFLSFGKSTSSNSAFLPISFEIDNIGNLISGSSVEVYLKSTPIPNALVIPVTAILEEQGIYYVFVQLAGESFQKREVNIGASDGEFVQIISGVKEGERVVTKGAYQIKLSAASGELPAHGHEH
jgi:RND family efflux transporter MFP subunit